MLNTGNPRLEYYISFRGGMRALFVFSGGNNNLLRAIEIIYSSGKMAQKWQNRRFLTDESEGAGTVFITFGMSQGTKKYTGGTKKAPNEERLINNEQSGLKIHQIYQMVLEMCTYRRV